jgi:hypothetical protein
MSNTIFNSLKKEFNEGNSDNTKLPRECNFFNKGNCINGDKCKFLHITKMEKETVSELKVPYEEMIPHAVSVVNEPQISSIVLIHNNLKFQDPYHNTFKICKFQSKCNPKTGKCKGYHFEHSTLNNKYIKFLNSLTSDEIEDYKNLIKFEK